MSKAPPIAPRALAVPRAAPPDAEMAEVIDLVLLPHGARPTPLAYVDWDEVPKLRILACDSYPRCLAFVAQVRWKSFHCRQCPRNPTSCSSPHPSTGEGEVVDLGE